ncbi:glutathione peroxidase [Clostridium sp. CF012]|nr:glutathione peroxidase [Clostridium sp. CF012]
MSIYNFNAITIDGDEVSMEQYRGKVLVIVNTASECGFTPQYEGLEKLYEQYKDKGFEILGFPSNQFAGQEPGESQEIKKFCTLNYGVSFQLFKKNDVRGENAQPLFRYLTEKTTFKGFDLEQPNEKKFNNFLKENYPKFLEENSVKWNFTKFLIDRDGNIADRYEPTTEPAAMASHIDNLLEKSKNNDVRTEKTENEKDTKKTFIEKNHIGENGDESLNIEGKPLENLYKNLKI